MMCHAILSLLLIKEKNKGIFLTKIKMKSFLDNKILIFFNDTFFFNNKRENSKLGFSLFFVVVVEYN